MDKSFREAKWKTVQCIWFSVQEVLANAVPIFFHIYSQFIMSYFNTAEAGHSGFSLPITSASIGTHWTHMPSC